jgi:hypothetical protein
VPDESPNMAETESERAFKLLIEEYKSLRDEIGRFQNQQKQLIGAVMAGIAALGAAFLNKANFSSTTTLPHLMLLGPLFFGLGGILFSEAEAGIIRAAYYTGVDLKRRAKALRRADQATLGREQFRATHEGKLSECTPPQCTLPQLFYFFLPKLLLFVFPSLACLFAFVYFGGGFTEDHTCTFKHKVGEWAWILIVASIACLCCYSLFGPLRRDVVALNKDAVTPPAVERVSDSMSRYLLIEEIEGALETFRGRGFYSGVDAAWS